MDDSARMTERHLKALVAPAVASAISTLAAKTTGEIDPMDPTVRAALAGLSGGGRVAAITALASTLDQKLGIALVEPTSTFTAFMVAERATAVSRSDTRSEIERKKMEAVTLVVTAAGERVKAHTGRPFSVIFPKADQAFRLRTHKRQGDVRSKERANDPETLGQLDITHPETMGQAAMALCEGVGMNVEGFPAGSALNSCFYIDSRLTLAEVVASIWAQSDARKISRLHFTIVQPKSRSESGPPLRMYRAARRKRGGARRTPNLSSSAANPSNW